MIYAEFGIDLINIYKVISCKKTKRPRLFWPTRQVVNFFVDR